LGDRISTGEVSIRARVSRNYGQNRTPLAKTAKDHFRHSLRPLERDYHSLSKRYFPLSRDPWSTSVTFLVSNHTYNSNSIRQISGILTYSTDRTDVAPNPFSNRLWIKQDRTFINALSLILLYQRCLALSSYAITLLYQSLCMVLNCNFQPHPLGPAPLNCIRNIAIF